jgi:hypothetical protein
MNEFLKTVLWQQFGASIDMLENTIRLCPANVWGDKFEFTEFWYISYHTLFFLDFYLSDGSEGFIPPEPFTLSELDPAGLFPERVYAIEELLRYLEHGREKAQKRISSLTEEKLQQHCSFGYVEGSVLEMLLDNMRHVQHHTAQLNLLLRQQINDATNWVTRTKKSL